MGEARNACEILMINRVWRRHLLRWKIKLEENIKMDLRDGFAREACGTASGSCSVAGFCCFFLLFFLMALQPLWALGSFQFPDLFKIGRTSWSNDQLVARPLPKHKTAQTQNKHIYTPNIYARSGIRTHDQSVRASEDSSCLRPPATVTGGLLC
jgi:hypothetical protein